MATTKQGVPTALLRIRTVNMPTLLHTAHAQEAFKTNPLDRAERDSQDSLPSRYPQFLRRCIVSIPPYCSNVRAPNLPPEDRLALHFCTVIVDEAMSGGLAESVAVTVMV